MVLDGVVSGYMTEIFDAERAVQVDPPGRQTIGQPRFCRQHTKPLVEAVKEVLKDPVGVSKGAGPRTPQISHQPVLEGSISPFDPSFGFGTQGKELGDAQLAEGTGGLGRSTMLQRSSLGCRTGGHKGGMPVGIDGQRDAVVLGDAPEQKQLALGGLLFLEDGMGRRTRRIVFRKEQAQARPALLEPGVRATIELEQHPFLRHPLPSHPVEGRMPVPGARQSRPRQEPPNGRAGQRHSLAFRQQL